MKILLLSLFFILILIGESRAVSRLEGIENFPESYRPYLLDLQSSFPEWRFIALYTGLDWEYVIDNQNIVRQKFSAYIL